VKKTDEKEQGMHHKRNRTDVSTSGKSVDASGNSGECSNNDTGSNTTKETDLDSAAHIDKNYEDNDDRSNDFDSDNFDAEEKNEMLQSKEPAGGVCSKRVDTSRNHHVSNEITKVGAKSRLRQRPVLNSALGN